MGLRFQSALNIDCLPDEQIDNQWECIMPTLNIADFSKNNVGENEGWFNKFTSLVGLDTYQPIVEEIALPFRNFEAEARRIRTGWLNLPKDIANYDTINITMFCSSGMLTQYYIEAWKAMVFNQEGEFYYSMCNYKYNIEVYFYGPGNIGSVLSPVLHVTLIGCFPTMETAIPLKYKDAPDRIRLTQSFKCDKIKVEHELVNSSIIKETTTSPYSMLDKAITKLSKDDYSVSKYNIDETYL